MASKNELRRQPQYASRHPENCTIKSAVLAGAAAAGRLADDHTIPANFPQTPTMNPDDLALMLKLDAQIVNELKRPHKRTWGDILRGW